MSQCIYSTLESLHFLEGHVFEPSVWKEVTQKEIDLFGQATGDNQWIHVDPVRAAKESPFRKKTVAHGYYSLALIPSFFFDMLEVIDCRLIVNLEANGIRWTAPVRIPSRVRLLATVKSVTSFESGVDLKLAMVIEVEHQRHPALEAEVTYRYYQRKAGQLSHPPSQSHTD